MHVDKHNYYYKSEAIHKGILKINHIKFHNHSPEIEGKIIVVLQNINKNWEQREMNIMVQKATGEAQNVSRKPNPPEKKAFTHKAYV